MYQGTDASVDICTKLLAAPPVGEKRFAIDELHFASLDLLQPSPKLVIPRARPLRRLARLAIEVATEFLTLVRIEQIDELEAWASSLTRICRRRPVASRIVHVLLYKRAKEPRAFTPKHHERTRIELRTSVQGRIQRFSASICREID
jgi:hypothetical protein